MNESSVRVMLIDDDPDEYVIIGDLLRSGRGSKFELTWASTYDRGIEALREADFDVCLVDFRLGQRSGLDLLGEVMLNGNHPEMILLTGAHNREVDLSSTKAGAADYLTKGELTPALLERSIRHAIERGRTLKELREAKKLAQSANAAKSAFLACMSHEMRTPMNAILGMAEVLWESNLDTAQRQYLEVFRRVGASLLVLINNLLDLSKIEAGHLELEHVEFDLQQVLNQAAELNAVKSGAKGVALRAHLVPGTPTGLIGDPARLTQILVNLLGNAVKFTEVGEIVLTARTAESGQPGEIEFTVSDTGIGIPPDKLESIFEDFTQADASTTRKYGGTGLGLGISRRLVNAIGGRLTVTSSVDKGSTFRFSAQFELLPEKPRSAASPPHFVSEVLKTRESSEPSGNVGRTERAPLRAARILVVEDSMDNQLLVKAYLQGTPHHATYELDGKAALDRFAVTDFDLVLMDVQMPVMDGLAATRAIRALERERGAEATPILALSATASRQDIEASGEAGCNGHLSKPISKLELVSAIDKHARRALPTMEAPPKSIDAIRIEIPSGLEAITPRYLENRRSEVVEMNNLLAISQFKRLAVLAHNLKGSGTGYGFPELTRVGAVLEELSIQENRASLGTQLCWLASYLDRVQLVNIRA